MSGANLDPTTELSDDGDYGGINNVQVNDANVKAKYISEKSSDNDCESSRPTDSATAQPLSVANIVTISDTSDVEPPID